jgi:hypothetical protein
MRIRLPLATGAMALGLVVATGRPAAAQDVTPPVSQDTSKADKPRVDTVDVGQPAGYRPMGTPEDCVPAGKPSELAAPGDTTVTPLADTAAVAAAAPDSAARKAAEAAGVYPAPAAKDCIPADPTKPGADKPIENEAPVKPEAESGLQPDAGRPDAVKPDTTSATGAIVR